MPFLCICKVANIIDRTKNKTKRSPSCCGLYFDSKQHKKQNDRYMDDLESTPPSTGMTIPVTHSEALEER